MVKNEKNHRASARIGILSLICCLRNHLKRYTSLRPCKFSTGIGFSSSVCRPIGFSSSNGIGICTA
jgi:hypothetical protein